MRPGRAARRAAAAFNGERVSRAEIAWAVPAGSARARCQGDFLEALSRDLELAAEHSVFQDHVRELGRLMARKASWEDRTVICPRELVRAELGIGLTCWKKCRRWLEDHGYLGRVREGRQAGFRRVVAAVLDTMRNDAAVYVLAVPRKIKRITGKAGLSGREARPPTDSRSESCSDHTRGDRAKTEDRTALRAGSPSGATAHPIPKRAVLKRLSDRSIGYFWAPFLAAGWTVDDFLFAVDHWPDGRQHRRDLTDVLYAGGWLRWRLCWWIGDDGQVLPSRSQQWAAANQALRRQQAERRVQLEAAAAAAVPPGSHFDQLRASRGWRRRK